MRTSAILAVLLLAATSLLAQASGTATNDASGLYYVSTDGTGQTLTAGDGPAVRLGRRADIKILTAHVYAKDNTNNDFGVMLYTSNFAPISKTPGEAQSVTPIALRIGDQVYTWRGYGGSGGYYNDVEYEIHGRDEAMAAAKWLSVDCQLREPPGYKFSARFIPAQPEVHANGPAPVKFVMKNLDDRTLVFKSGGRQFGRRDGQYEFRALRNGRPVTALPNAAHFGGGLTRLVTLEPGKEFEGQVDLAKWFNFDQPGTYSIHGSYLLDFYPAGEESKMSGPWNELWSDTASADFTVVVK